MFESVLNGFRPKEAPVIFSHLLLMERSRNLPDLSSPLSTFRDKILDTITDINRLKLQDDRSVGVAMTSIQTFSDVRSE